MLAPIGQSGLDRAIVNGRQDPISVYEVLNALPEPIRELKLKTQSRFEAGIEAYSDRTQMTTAKACFEEVLAINLHDKTAALYLDRVNQLLTQGIPETWTGIWTFTHK